MILTDKQIAEIAANLEFGMRCFYNLKTGVIKEVPDFTIGLVWMKNHGTMSLKKLTETGKIILSSKVRIHIMTLK